MSLPLHLMRHAEPVAFVRLPAGRTPTGTGGPGRCPRSPTPTARRRWSAHSRPCRPGAAVQGPLIAFEIAGPLDFSTVGVLSGLLEPLAKQGISILALSTYDTDWILIGAEHADEAMATWKRDGNTAAPARLSGGPS